MYAHLNSEAAAGPAGHSSLTMRSLTVSVSLWKRWSMRKAYVVAAASLATFLACVMSLPATADAAKSYDSVAAVSDGDWWLWGRTAQQQNFSPLTGINDKNAQQLGLAWYSDVLNVGDLEGEPLVVDEVAYV